MHFHRWSFDGKGQMPRLLPMEAAARRIAGSPSQSMPIGLDSSPKGRAFGSPRKLHLFAKASPFEERLPPRRGKMSHSDKRGSVASRSDDGEGSPPVKIQSRTVRRLSDFVLIKYSFRYSCAKQSGAHSKWSGVTHRKHRSLPAHGPKGR